MDVKVVILYYQLLVIIHDDTNLFDRPNLTCVCASGAKHASTDTLSGKLPLKWSVSTTSLVISPANPNFSTAQSLPGAYHTCESGIWQEQSVGNIILCSRETAAVV